jgi:hypothetical protein
MLWITETRKVKAIFPTRIKAKAATAAVIAGVTTAVLTLPASAAVNVPCPVFHHT